MEAAELKKRVLEVFVTSAEDPIYAIKNTIPPELFGAFGSYFSRNPKDFREHLLHAISGAFRDEEDLEGAKERLLRLSDEDLSDPSDFILEGLERAQEFFRKWYGRYSHKSIANTVWIPMVATNVSQLFAKELAYDQLAFFIEQSTRYVKWNLESMFLDEDISASSNGEDYIKTLELLAEGYHRLSKKATEYYKELNPFDEWLAKQPIRVQNAELDAQQADYKRQIRGAALDVARFLLPQACRTNIAWILDARSTEFDIAAWKSHPLKELRDDALLIEKHAGQIAPSLLKYTQANDYYGDKLRGYNGELPNVESRRFSKGVDLISHDPDSLNKAVAHILKRYNRGTFKDAYSHVSEMSFDEKMLILARTVEKRGEFDEWVEMDEDFDLIKVAFEIRTDLGAARDWRRHQKWDRGESLYTLDNGYHCPEIINNLGTDVTNDFNRLMEIAHQTEMAIRNSFPYQAQYIVPMAANHPLTMSSGLDQLQYMLYTRSTPQGHFSYREDAFNIAETVTRKMPWLLGYEKYPEEKSFMEVYKNAPLKKLLHLQTEETALHN